MDINEFLFYEFQKRVNLIVKKSEQNRIPNYDEVDNFYKVYCEFFFVLNRYIQSKIQVIKWNVKKSACFKDHDLSPKSKKQLRKLEKLLAKGDKSVNHPSLGYLPKSSKDYYLTTYNDKSNYRYNSDFSNHLFGIKHLHLDAHDKTEDSLLYYITYGFDFIFLRIGKHEDLYTDKNLTILVKEYPDLLDKMNITEMTYPVKNTPVFSPEEIQKMWLRGDAVGFWIDNKYYTSLNLMSGSRISLEHQRLASQMYHEVQENIRTIKERLGNNTKDLDIKVCTESSISAMKDRNIVLKVDSAKQKFICQMPCSRLLNQVDYIHSTIN